MKKIAYLLLLLILSGCSSDEPIIAPDAPETPSNPETPETPVEAVTIRLSTAERTVVDGFNDFADRLIDMSMEGHADYSVSPVSVSVYMSMLANSCSGESRQQFLEALGTNDLEALNKLNAKLIEYFESPTLGALTCVANRVWMADRYKAPASYTATMSQAYNADVQSVDFSKPSTIPAINAWVKENTNGMINGLVDATRWQEYVNTPMVSANTVYFKGKWLNEFDPTQTKNDYFNTPDGRKQVAMMHQTNAYGYASDETASLVSVDFTGYSYALEIYLPVQITSAGDISRVINADERAKLRAKLNHDVIKLAMPRLDLRCNADLAAVMSHMGLTSLDAVNLSPMGIDATHQLALIHSTAMALDEKGAEIAAVTGGIGTSTGQEPMVRTMRVDHPFMYVVRNRVTDAIILAGVVSNP